ncbi:hypothetical protein Godav_020095 [Gossypium davidsonii]|uniref:RNase H type-1 domain-containing protein n=1 Tax=Gossypium davidsonii TaxID=34287 RepID=A0A7J8R3C1_GOSDV|nr:hypothetical protein [Gossypium davidsonii]
MWFSPISSKGHGYGSKGKSGRLGRALNKTIHGCGRCFKLFGNSHAPLPEAMTFMEKFFGAQVDTPIDKADAQDGGVKTSVTSYGGKADLIIVKLSFLRSHHVEAVGFSSGIWIGWSESICVEKGQGEELVMTTCGFCGHGSEEVLHVFSINEILKVSHSWARQCTSASKASPYKIQRSLASPSIASSWVCLKTDGLVRNEEGFAAAGGLVCDHNGGWIIEFCRYLGSCTVTEV